MKITLGKNVLHEFSRFGLVGLLNTAVGYGVFLLCYRVMGFSPYLANALGYVVALIAAYFLYTGFVFKVKSQSHKQIVLYAVSFAIAFSVNQFVLFSMEGRIPVYIAQMFAMFSYTVSFYVFNKLVTFRAR